ncbi:hypothetical protein A2482_03705 [Candidatus Falkowbacteria bacterium RIFOXYC2_FULL_48_21]|uniref:HTH cro/C1-type domain-containing protein n=1 Tax=Candidatus Falkowbacteria bacterium RIFOXYC2_FULL_48_21 TaxID=1798005 RepID=A0A1F5T5H7_9BACT|nr:MAG: hypothetical protein A2482_03705 [Candidatus Falkowbacteria bacterium RIFOXYC2_FULL_48_21]
MIFTAKKISGLETLGEKLRQHREKNGWSLEKAARLISTNVENVIKIENNDYVAMPPAVYATNILKNYAKILQLNPIMVVECYEKEKLLFDKTRQRGTKQKISRLYQAMNDFLNPRTLKYLIIISLSAAIVVYLGFEVNRIISPPMVEIFSPADDLTTENGQVTIAGQTEKEVSVQINDQPLLIDQDGRFTLTLNLQNGLNIVKISARKKHSKETVIHKKIMVEEPQAEL